MFTPAIISNLELSLGLALSRLIAIQPDFKIKTLRIDDVQEKAVFKISPIILSFIKENYEYEGRRIFLSPKSINFSFKASHLTVVSINSLCLLCFLLDKFIESQQEKMADIKKYLTAEIAHKFTGNFTIQINSSGKQFAVILKRRIDHLCFLETNLAEIKEFQERIRSPQMKKCVTISNPKGIAVSITYTAIRITGRNSKELLRRATEELSPR